MNNNEKMLLEELQKLEKSGVVLRLGENISDSRQIAHTLYVKDSRVYGDYMRDYIYDDGTLKEIRFDKVNNI